MDPKPESRDPGLADLPPVEPPSAKFIVQLFIIPIIVVVVLVVGWLLIRLPFGELAGGDRDAMNYVRTIRSGNDNSRFRAAYDLSSLLHTDPRLANDPELLGALTDLLQQELARPGVDERIEQYLALTLGAFQTLDSRLNGIEGPDPLAVLAKALGEKYPTPVRISAAISLAKQAARLEGTLEDEEAVRALAEASRAEAPDLREASTWALGFFGGEPAVAALHRALTDSDRVARYNAANALARRGDMECAPVVREMLSPDDLRQVLKLKEGQELPQKIETITLQALDALRVSVRGGHPELAILLRPQVDALATSGLVSIRTEAAELLKIIPARP